MIYYLDFETPCGVVLEIEFSATVGDDVEIIFVEGISPCGFLIDGEDTDKLLTENEDNILEECVMLVYGLS